jgi:uncharacterized protein YegP (UPF0339 family)
VTRGSRPVVYETDGGDRITVYPDGGGLWRWRRKSANGRTVADGAEGYARKDGALRAARRSNPEAPRVR